MLKILGIDPGMALMGFALLNIEKGERGPRLVPGDFGVIETPKGESTAKRLLTIRNDLRELFATLEPHCLAIETFFVNPALFNNNAMVLYARGQVLLTAEEAGLSIYEYEPSKVKMNVGGHGKATKQDMQDAVAGVLGLPERIRPDDANDAMAVAYMHFLQVEHEYTARGPR